MTFKTSVEMFTDGVAVPYDLNAAPGTGAANRGINFGEQLTAAIANRTHYALALNTDDLNTRLAEFETGGLDAAYANGTVGPRGGGRDITKDGGAVETVSALATAYADDIANAHFRANQIGDVLRGGGGFESVSYGRAGIGALYGFMDRRALNFSDYSEITDTESVSLGVGTAGITLVTGGHRWMDGSNNTNLIPGFDMIEVLTGNPADLGLYVLGSFSSTTLCTVKALDGGTPAFAGGAATARVFRPTFGSFSWHGHTGALGFRGTTLLGLPVTDSALDIIAGGVGRFDDGIRASGADNALRVRWRDLLGSVSNGLVVDAYGQVRSYVSSVQLTAAQLATSPNFGAPAFVVQQDKINDVEVGFLARSNGVAAAGIEQWFGVVAAGDVRTGSAVPMDATPGGLFAFTFIDPVANAGANVGFSDMAATENYVNPLITLVEVVTPSANAGVYLVSARAAAGADSGELTLTDLEGNAVVFTPVTYGLTTGTARILYTVSLGGRNISVGTALITGQPTTGRAGAVIQSPKLTNGIALLLESAGEFAVTGQVQYLVRGVTSFGGITSEVFTVTADGIVAASKLVSAKSGGIQSLLGNIVADAGNIEATAGTVTGGAGLIATTGGVTASAGDVTATIGNVISGGYVRAAGSVMSAQEFVYGPTARYDVVLVGGDEGLGPNWSLDTAVSIPRQKCTASGKILRIDITDYLPGLCTLMKVEVLLNSTGTADQTASLYQEHLGAAFNTPGLPVEASLRGPVLIAGGGYQVITLEATPNPAVGLVMANRSAEKIYVELVSGSTSVADLFYGLRLTFLNYGLSNA